MAAVTDTSWRRYLASDIPYIIMYVLLTHIFFYKFLVPGQTLFGTDTMTQSYPMQVVWMREILHTHSIPLWNPYMLGGMPLLASFSFHILYPGSWIFFLMPVDYGMGYIYILHFCLMGIFFHYFGRELGLSRPAAFVGALLFMFNAHLVSLVYPGHGGKIITIAFLPLGLMFVERAFKRSPGFNFLMLGLVVGLMFYGGHPQILFYCGIALSLFFIARLGGTFKKEGAKESLKRVGMFALAFAVGALLYAAVLFPAMEYRGYTHRGGGATGATSYEFATSFSQPPEDMLYLALRDPFGWGKDYGPDNPSRPGEFYRGRIGLRLSVDYVGVFGLVLAMIGVIFARNRNTWFFLGLGLLAGFLAMGSFNPFYSLVYRFVPGFSLFRVPYAIMILLPICWGVLGAFGLEWLISERSVKGAGLTRFIYAGIGFAALSLAVAVYMRTHLLPVAEWFTGFDWVRQMLWEDYTDIEARLGYFVKNVYVFAALLSASMALLFAYRRGLINKKLLPIVAALFILVDLWPVGWEFIKTVPIPEATSVFIQETPQIKYMEEDKSGPFRVFSQVTNNEPMYYGIETATGYHAVMLSHYEKMLESVNFQNPVLDLMNAKYLMLPKDPEFDFRNAQPQSARDYLMKRFELVSDDKMYFYRNRTALPRAFLVNKMYRAPSVEDAYNVIVDPTFNPREGAVVVEDPEKGATMDPAVDLSTQKVTIPAHTSDSFEMYVDAPGDSFLVVSEVWYPGWRAYIDGREAKIYRTDYFMRGLFMPKGSHKVTMVFDPPLFKLGGILSLLTLAGVIAVAVVHRRAGASRRL